MKRSAATGIAPDDSGISGSGVIGIHGIIGAPQ